MQSGDRIPISFPPLPPPPSPRKPTTGDRGGSTNTEALARITLHLELPTPRRVRVRVDRSCIHAPSIHPRDLNTA